jgi:hypothetical protein
MAFIGSLTIIPSVCSSPSTNLTPMTTLATSLAPFKNRKYSLVFGNKFGGLSVLVYGGFCSWKEEPPRKIEYYETKEFPNQCVIRDTLSATVASKNVKTKSKETQ